MSTLEIINGLSKNDPQTAKHLFDMYYGQLSAIAMRYAKNKAQAAELFNHSFNVILNKLRRAKPSDNLDAFIKREFITECVGFIKEIRSEYYVASTVYAGGKDNKNYDLFEPADIIDYDTVDDQIIMKALQQLVPSQRLIFNLHVIENFSLDESADILEASVHTAKANLEKARYNLQKNIEKCLKEARYEQSF